jgi:hypothetical protein
VPLRHTRKRRRGARPGTEHAGRLIPGGFIPGV